jgi:hypothetical protein
MFFCETCRLIAGWPRGFLLSHGTCELCGKMKPCHNIPMKDLPSADKIVKEKER